MTKAPRIDVDSKRELHLLKLLGRGSVEFKDLTMEEKLIVWHSKVDISQAVPQEQLEAFHAERSGGRLGREEEPVRSVADKVRSLIPSQIGRGT